MSVRIAFIGVGGIAQTHLKAVSENQHAEIVAACDVVRERAEAAAHRPARAGETATGRRIDDASLNDSVFGTGTKAGVYDYKRVCNAPVTAVPRPFDASTREWFRF